MPRQERSRAVNLLKQHDPDQLVRPGGGAKSQGEAGLVAQRWGEAIGTADDEGRRRAVLGAPGLQLPSEIRAAQAPTALTENHRDGALGQDVGDGNRFLDHAPRDVVGAALADFDDVDRGKTNRASDLRRTLAVTLSQISFRPLLQSTDRGDHDAHVSPTITAVPSADVPTLWARPHLLKLIEGAHLGPEHMHRS